MAIGDIIKTTHICSFGNQVSNNVNYWVQTSSAPGRPSATVLKAIADAFSNGIGVAIKETMVGTAKYEGVIVYDLWKDSDLLPQQQATSTLGSGAGGSGLDTPSPIQSAGLIRKRTPYTSRRGRGRMYVPFPPQDAMSGEDELIAAAYNTALLDIVVALSEGVSVTSGGQTWTYAQCLVTQSDPVSQIGLRVTSYTVGKALATQRRRSYYGRPNTVPAL